MILRTNLGLLMDARTCYSRCWAVWKSKFYVHATPWLISTQVLGDRGVHARSAVGTNALPLGVPVEIEAVVEVEAGS